MDKNHDNVCAINGELYFTYVDNILILLIKLPHC